MQDRTRRNISISVSLVIVATAVVMVFFPETERQNSKPTGLQAQVIVPARSSRRPAAKSTQQRSSQQPAAPVASKGIADIWQIIELGGKNIGYSRMTFRRKLVRGETRILSTSVLQMTVLRFGQPTQMRVKSETSEMRNGDLLSFRVESGSGGTAVNTISGRLKYGRMLVKTTLRKRTTQRSYPWKRGIKSPTYLDRLVREVPLKPRERRRFETFVPELGKVTEIRISAQGFRNVTMRDGKRRRLLRVRVTQSISPTESVFVYLDKKGVPLKTESEMIAQKMIHYTVSAAEALRSIGRPELDIGLSTLIRIPFIKNAHNRKQIVYRIHMLRNNPANFLTDGGTQRVRSISADTVDLTVSKSRMPRRSLRPRTAKEFVRPSRFLQSDDPRVREHARRAAGYDTDPVRIALNMEQYVHDKLKNKNFSTAMATAAEVARDLQGDCTEHAVLLAAMLRVRRIPSRIVIGLIYVPRISSFGAHMWTEARLGGEWVPLDATMGRGGTGPGHIKLADASFADNSAAPITAFLPLMNILGRWRIEVREIR